MDKGQPVSKSLIFSTMLLVAGTSIGGGMLALPVATGLSGFLPSIAVMFCAFLAMTISALLLLEATLWMEEGAHIITIAGKLLGTSGQAISWILYLFICYASLIGYTAAGGSQIASLFRYFEGALSNEAGCILFIFAFGFLVDLGARFIGRINTILFIAMCAAYFALVGMGIDEVRPSLLKIKNWSYAWLAIPLLLTTFSFHTMVPSLPSYLKRQVKPLRLAIAGGTFITFLIYAIWQWLILGIVPIEGPGGLAEALSADILPTAFLNQHVHGVWISNIADFFAFFAITTSFLGIVLGLFDFLSDGLKIKKTGTGKTWLAVLIVVPTLICATQFEHIFIIAMETSGGFGDTILNGMIPVLMVWIGRYRIGYKSSWQVPGGKPLLGATFLFFAVSLFIAVLARITNLSPTGAAETLIQFNQ